ncbi:MAG: HAD family hydrolase [Bacillota bacterium]|nr:HAD family hydrolase [Bacillota bacterium]
MKLYITDLDGTLLNSEKEISAFSKSTLNTLISKGVNFSIASARSLSTALKILSGLKLNAPIALMNGVALYDMESGKYINIEALAQEPAEEIVNILKMRRVEGFMYTISDGVLNTYYETLSSNVLTDFRDERIKKYNKTFEQIENFKDKISENNIIYFTLLDEYETLIKVYETLKDMPGIEISLYKDVYSDNLYFLEIYSKNASKRNAVNYLRENYNFDEIIGFGDNLNDIPMLKACDEFYAVANAVDELKKLATGVIGDNDSDGVAKYIAKKECLEGY